MNGDEGAGWDAATWEGSRRAQLRRALKLTVRERLEALEALAEVDARLRGLRRGEGVSDAGGDGRGGGTPG